MADANPTLSTAEPVQRRERGAGSAETIIATARQQSAEAEGFWSPHYDAADAEIRFVAGEQWDAEVLREREQSGRPCLTVNRMLAMCDQVIGDARQNSPSIQVSPADGSDTMLIVEDFRGEPRRIHGAEVMERLIRQIEYRSRAEQHYDLALQHAIEGAVGFLRVRTTWSDPRSFTQEPRIECIRDRFNVFIDPGAQEQDASDANYAFIVSAMSRDEFAARYPDRTPGAPVGNSDFWTDTERACTVAEYFWREPWERRLIALPGGETVYGDELGKTKREQDAALAAQGLRPLRERTISTWRVWWAKVSGSDVLEGPVLWPGSTIPIVPVWGKHIDHRRGTEYRGLCRPGIDAQRMLNFWLSAMVERAALAPKAPWLVTPRMVAGFETQWQEAATANHPYLPYNPDPEAPGAMPQRNAPPPMPQAELMQSQVFSDHIKNAIGIHDAALGARSNETSGKAIMARQREADVGSFAFFDNQARAIARIGTILVEIIPVIYDTERVVQLRGADGASERMTLNKAMTDPKTGEAVLVQDLAAISYDVRVKTGPSYTTQREETVANMMDLLKINPGAAPLMMDILIDTMDWPGAAALSDRLRKGGMVPAHLLTEDEQAKLPQPQPTPEQQAEAAKAQATMAKAEADVAQAEADKLKAQAEMMTAQAAIQAGPGDERLKGMIGELVAQSVADMLAQIQQANQPPQQTNQPGAEPPMPTGAM